MTNKKNKKKIGGVVGVSCGSPPDHTQTINFKGGATDLASTKITGTIY